MIYVYPGLMWPVANVDMNVLLPGSHILASKPVAVFSGGRYTMFKKMHMSNGFVEQLPPVETWGRYFIVQSSPVVCSFPPFDSLFVMSLSSIKCYYPGIFKTL